MTHHNLMIPHILLLSLYLFSNLDGIGAGESNHKYDVGEPVNLWVNKIGPYHNPQETYPYYKLPFCKPQLGLPTQKKRAGIGEILEGNELRNSGYFLAFAEDVERTVICSMTLDKLNAKAFSSAVRENYWYSMYLDDLPIWGMVGQETSPASTETTGVGSGGSEKVIFTHRKFTVAFNGPRIVEVNLTSENPEPIAEGHTLDFSYSVHWAATDKHFHSRFDRYLDNDFFEHQIHWFSIFNSFMMVIFLCGLVFLILMRTLKNDFARYANADEGLEIGDNMGEDSGWKQVHGDVFRAPVHLMWFAALIGTGWQLVVLVLGVILFAVAGPLHGDVYEERGEMLTASIVCYALSTVVAGYASGAYYKQYFTTPKAELGSKWQQTMLVTVVLLPTVVASGITVLDMVATYYDTTNTIPFVVILKMFAIWIFVSFPLAVSGTMFGRHWAGKGDFPCRVNTFPRPIPKGPWYTKPVVFIPLTGILPFGSIFIEMYFVFTSFWNYKFYYVYGFMLLVYLILIIVTICTTIVTTYFVLNSENYHWQWISFLSAGSTAAYVFVYSFYYFFFKTQMSGFLQVAFYFGYMGLFCLGLFVLTGTIGLYGSTKFVRSIYRNVKVD
mmetsp:Transcript_35820/g.47291  ORF Transcript_35820/g.47291 Transcript_35820/m.47291 type:complete len:612 (-) Transcript_35820:410-2245(-)|eukprot:CAMPEP_0117759650 /NCGR_PEP_ID=MMETSP0947-20121206/16138_1 /TAXON_ID=44440 /ORGANISM="Chattonella subsalsa, Strain CCMP2191" /LENGTH=611 /DNA_ID=CAMNT_0005580145 /DNA_START=266 /DNA_END=2101 /DNA_ORIENTATION=+